MPNRSFAHQLRKPSERLTRLLGGILVFRVTDVRDSSERFLALYRAFRTLVFIHRVSSYFTDVNTLTIPYNWPVLTVRFLCTVCSFFNSNIVH